MDNGVARPRELTAMPAMALVLSPVVVAPFPDSPDPSFELVPVPVPTGAFSILEVVFELGKGGRIELDDDG